MSRTNFFVVSLLLMLFLAACGKDEVPPMSVVSSDIIVGSKDWFEITTLASNDPMRINSLAVGDVNLPVMQSRCTGFLISEDVLMTNHHCIPAERYAEGVTVSFDHEAGIGNDHKTSYNCDTFIMNDEALDFALLRCEGSPGAEVGFVELSETSAKVQESIYLIHQNCDYYMDRSCDWNKKLSLGKITEIAAELTHDADTLGGSSGSPVFSKKSHKVIGIHHAGYGNNGYGRGMFNMAVPMEKIVAKIKKAKPDILGGGSSDPVEPTFGLKMSDSISKSGEQDSIDFEVPEEMEVTITLSFKHSKGDLDMTLYDDKGNRKDYSNGVKDTEKIQRTLSAGSYTLKVYGYRSATGAYELEIK